MSPIQIVLMLPLVLGAGFVQSATGFGFAIVLMALLPLFIPYGTCQLIAVTMSLLGNSIIVLRSRQHIQWKQLPLPLLFGAAGTLMGLLLIKGSGPEVYKRLLGLFLCLLAIWFIFFDGKVKIRGNARNGALIGAFSGVCGGVFSINGPPMVIYYLSVMEDMKQYRATIQTYFMALNILNLSARAVLDLIPQGSLTALLLAAPMVVAGNLLGVRAAEKVDTRRMRRYIYIFLAAAGLYIAVTG